MAYVCMWNDQNIIIYAIKISGFGFTPIASNGNRLVSSDSKFIGGEIDNPF